jgi:hypothetical protein
VAARVVAFRITKRTARRIYYDANILARHAGRIRYIDRQAIETAGKVSRKSGHWWEPDLQLWLKPTQTWPPQQQPDLATLKAQMAAAHPDRGGSDAEFIAARQRYERARTQAGAA